MSSIDPNHNDRDVILIKDNKICYSFLSSFPTEGTHSGHVISLLVHCAAFRMGH